jgi:2-methylcitrate dehydratase PrpD
MTEAEALAATESEQHARTQLVATATPTAALARFASGLAWPSLTAAERHAAKRHLLDGLAACVAGSDQPVVRKAAGLIADLVPAGDVPVPGAQERRDLLSAAYLMGVSGHALELDDGNREGSLHPGTAVVPALLAAAYKFDADGASTLCALVGGYEVAVSLAEVLHPHAARRGFQTTGVVGLLGAAAATGRLLDLDATTMERAIGIGASSSAGIFGYLVGGGNVKKLHPGHAAREGVFAALVAQREVVEGPLGIAEVKGGVFEAFGGITPWQGPAVDHRGGALAITRSYLKPYPCCRHIHPAIDALLELRQRHELDADRVARIDVGTYEAAMPHARLGWSSFTVAQLSFPFVMATALRSGRVDLESFTDAARRDSKVIADAAKVVVATDPQCCASYPKEGPARVTVTTTSGEQYSHYVGQPLGAPERPLSDEDLFRKFRGALQGRVRIDPDVVIDAVWQLEEAPSVRSLLDRLAG